MQSVCYSGILVQKEHEMKYSIMDSLGWARSKSEWGESSKLEWICRGPVVIGMGIGVGDGQSTRSGGTGASLLVLLDSGRCRCGGCIWGTEQTKIGRSTRDAEVTDHRAARLSRVRWLSEQ